jgi:8-oxo-dGTP pyrophosphatase MutT (NUDIX family)
LREETSIASCHFVDDVSFTETYTFVKNGERIEKTVMYFLAIVGGDCNTCPIEEIADVKWVPFDEVEMVITFDEARKVWREARPIAEGELKEGFCR